MRAGGWSKFPTAPLLRERGRPPVLIVVFAFFAPSRFKCPMAEAGAEAEVGGGVIDA
jgi:hypothetical protein